MAYAWSTDLETGNPTIDGQHKELFEAINKLLEACSIGQGRKQITETGQFLLNYTKKHFGDEEALQRKSAYPDFANHKGYHDAFVRTVHELVDELNTQGPTIVSVSKVNTAIAGWLINHIKREDVKVAKHIKSKNI